MQDVIDLTSIMIWKPAISLFSTFTLLLVNWSLADAQGGASLKPKSLKDWKIENAAPDGKISLNLRNYRAYVCLRADLVEAVLEAILDRAKSRATVKHPDTAMVTALRKNNCAPAKGLYEVTAVGRWRRSQN